MLSDHTGVMTQTQFQGSGGRELATRANSCKVCRLHTHIHIAGVSPDGNTLNMAASAGNSAS